MAKKARKWLLVFFTIICCIPLIAQHIVDGKVIDNTGNPISFASVKWKKDTAGVNKYYAIANQSGFFRLNVHMEFSGWIEVSAVGYNIKKNIFVSFVNLDTVLVDIVLSDSATTLQEIFIKNLPSISISGDTTSFLADKFKRGNESSVKQLLSSIPGFSVTSNGSFVYNGKLIDRVLINDDDLSGRNYSDFLANLDITGIEQLQVIQNQPDKSNVLSGLTGGKEQVLNIKYKKGFLQKLFGNIESSIGVPLKYNSAAMQAVSLYDKTKIILLNKTNSTGTINWEHSNEKFTIEGVGNDPLYDIQSPERYFVGGITDIQTNNENIKAVFQNKSFLSSVNFLVKPTKKLLVRGRVGFGYDKYSQSMDNFTEYSFGLQTFQIFQKRNITKRLNGLSSLLSASFLPNSKSQFSFSLKSSNDWNTSMENTVLPGNKYYLQTGNSLKSMIAARFVYSRLLSSKSALSISLQQQNLKLPGNYIISPFLFHQFFYFPANYSLIRQSEQQRVDEFISRVSVIQKFKRNIFTTEVTFEYFKESLSNSIFTEFGQINSFSVINDSVNFVRNRRYLIKLLLRDSWRIGTRTTCSFQVSFLGFANKLTNVYKKEYTSKSEKLKLLPEITIEHKLSDQNNFIFSWNRNNKFTDLLSATSGFFIRDFTSIYSGTNVISEGVSDVIRLSYFHSNLLRKRVIFFSSFLFQRSPQLSILEIQPFQNFVYNKAFFADKNTQTMVLSFGGQKLSKNYRTQFSPSINLASGDTYLLINGNQARIRFNQVQSAIQFRTEIRELQISSQLKYSLNKQLGATNSKNKYLESSVQVNWKFSDRLFIESGFQYYYLKSTSQPSAYLWNVTSGILIKLKNNKWEIGFHINNLLNQHSYSHAIQSLNSISVTSYRVFPRFSETFIKYRF